MKNLILFILAVACFSLLACTKSAKIGPASSSISATVNGANEQFTLADSVRFNGTSGIYVAGINPANGDHVMIFAGATNGTFGPGTFYTDSTTTPRGSEIMFRDGGVSPGANGYGGYYYTYDSYNNVDYSGSVTFTVLTDTLVKGTFSGFLVSENSVVGATGLVTKNITNGKFNIYLK